MFSRKTVQMDSKSIFKEKQGEERYIEPKSKFQGEGGQPIERRVPELEDNKAIHRLPAEISFFGLALQ